MAVEYQSFIIDIKQNIGIILVQEKENARLILGTLVGGIISLMVFSFSMVMIVLNQASSSLSPRVIPGLITQKSHQIVLGMYLGTIIYCLILIINIQSSNAKYQIPTLGILFAMIFGITCIGLFVYFIHSISRSIQVDNILDKIFHHTSRQMATDNQQEDSVELPDTSTWSTIYTNHSGYLKKIDTSTLLKICKKHNLTVLIMEHIGFFLVNGYPFLKVSEKVDKEVEEDIRSCFIFYIEEHVADHYLFGFKQISEIAVKALSPGINDPGTAIKAIDMLSILFIKKMKLKEKNYVLDEDKKLLVIFKKPTLEELLYENLTPIREYGKQDATVMLNLIESLKNLAYADKDNRSYQPVISKYIRSMVISCEKHITNDLDMEQLDRMIEKINTLLGGDYYVKGLEG
ncbi:MAG: hypothetical protein DHS20C18_14220 [Saprospiraceae bacterium]|nr:MAG: hypothetical protein DHS20C18_14220 [Saprospiraceae bacterium]